MPRPRAPAGSAGWALGGQQLQVGGGQLAGGDQQQRELLQRPRPAQPGNAQARVTGPDVLAPLVTSCDRRPGACSGVADERTDPEAGGGEAHRVNRPGASVALRG